MLGLYLHVPFCASICHYCNFNRGLLDEALKQRYVRAVTAELDAAAGRHGWPAGAREVDTIFFGGGTPSLLSGPEIAAMLDACRRTFAVASGAEVSLEANPETVSVATLDAFRAAGVNRLSYGVQSFREPELRRLGRLHDVPRAVRAVAEARAAGFDNVSLDLMMWLPEQSIDQWLESVEAAIGLAPDHLSLYILELYPNAPLREQMARSQWSQAPDDDAATMYEAAMDRLERAGFEQDQISNVARPGRQCRHNLKYWTDGEWLGVGPGAHSTVAGVRWKNVSSTDEYVARVTAGLPIDLERRVLSDEDRWQEALITGLRLNAGVSVTDIRTKYGLDLWARYGDHLQPYLEAGLLMRTGDRLHLSRAGMLLANEVLAVFI